MANYNALQYSRYDRRKAAAVSFGSFVRVMAKQREMLTGSPLDDSKYKKEDYTEIYRKTPHLIAESSINLQLLRLNPAKYEIEVFSEPEPSKEAIRARLEKQAEDEIKSFFWWKNKTARKRFVEDNLAIQYDAEYISWQRRRNDFIAKQALMKQRFEEAAKKECEEKKAPLLRLLSQDEEVISKGLKDVANTLDIPGGYGLDFFLDNGFKTIYVDVDLPDMEEIPCVHYPYYTANRPNERETAMEVQQDYIRCICGIAFYVSGELFNVNTGIENIQFSGYTRRLNRSKGDYEEGFVLSVFFDRESFGQLSIERMDPTDSILDFPVLIKPTNAGILSTITPFSAPGDFGFKRGAFPKNESKIEEPIPSRTRLAIQPLYTPPVGFMSRPQEIPTYGRSASSIYPTARVVFEGTEIMGKVFENVIRYKIPKYDFGRGLLADSYKKTPSYFKRDVQEVFRIQQHFASVIQAAEKFEKEGNYEQACYYYEQLLFEKYYDPQPIDRLIQIYGMAHLTKAKMEVLKEAIAHFKSLKQERELYLDALSKRIGMPGAASYQIERGQVISYYGVFELYNPFNIISDWETELKRLNEIFALRPYAQDINLPSHGRRAKVDNMGTIRVKISRRSGLICPMGPDSFDLYLIIKLASKTYHATLESEGESGNKRVIDIIIPTNVIEGIVELSRDQFFMSLKDEDIFPDIMMLDGNDVTISVKTDECNLVLNSNMLDDTLSNGIISVEGGEIQTPFHHLAEIAFEKLGIEPDDFEEEDNPL